MLRVINLVLYMDGTDSSVAVVGSFPSARSSCVVGYSSLSTRKLFICIYNVTVFITAGVTVIRFA